MLNYDQLVFDSRLCRLAGSQGLPVRPGLPTSGGSGGFLPGPDPRKPSTGSPCPAM